MENTFFSNIDSDCDWESRFIMSDETDFLQIQNHICYIFSDAVYSGKFMKHVVDFDRRNSHTV